MNYASGLAQQTAELHSLIVNHPAIAEHPKGHSNYLLRYRTSCGAEIALEKRAGAPLLYFTRSLAEGRINDLNPE